MVNWEDPRVIVFFVVGGLGLIAVILVLCYIYVLYREKKDRKNNIGLKSSFGEDSLGDEPNDDVPTNNNNKPFIWMTGKPSSLWRTEMPSTSQTEMPSTSRTEMSSTWRAEMPSTSKGEMSSTWHAEMPSTSRTEIPSTSWTEVPSTSQTEMPTTIRTKTIAEIHNYNPGTTNL